MQDHEDRRIGNRAALGACVLTAAGGAMDAWVYLLHGHLFANAQTGNVVLFAIHMAAGELSDAVRFVPSIVAFIVGLFSSRLLGAWLKTRNVNSRTFRLAAECLLLMGLSLVVGSLPNAAVAASVGFIAALQITSLSHIGPASFNTGMTTGNLRTAVSAGVLAWLDPEDRSDRRKSIVLGCMCLAFLAGAMLGGVSTRQFGDRTVLMIAGLVGAAFLVLRCLPDPLPE